MVNHENTIRDMANIIEKSSGHNPEHVIFAYIGKTRKDVSLSSEYEGLAGLSEAIKSFDKNDYKSLADNIAIGLSTDNVERAYEIRDALYKAIESGFSNSKQ